MVIEECHHIELMPGALNRLSFLRNVTFNKAHSIVIHTRVFDSRKPAKGPSLPLENFIISNVRNLEVRRNSFEGIEIYGTFSLNNVLLKSVPSLTFNFDFVNEFEIIGSRLHRVSMWGIKLNRCHEFRATDRTAFLSLSSHAFYMSCQNFILLQNDFGSLQDSSLNVSYRYAEIRKNTFESISGKPFMNLRHEAEGGSFIFRENKFRVDSTLPEDALAMPDFGSSVDYYIDNNHFVCDCNKLSWLIYKAIHDSEPEELSQFLTEVVKSSGKCLLCDGRRCRLGEENFMDFLRSISVSKDTNGYTCSERLQIPEKITEIPFDITKSPNEEEEFKEHEEIMVTAQNTANRLNTMAQPTSGKEENGGSHDQKVAPPSNQQSKSINFATPSSIPSVFVPFLSVILSYRF
eukprot:TRINITY_DN25103_c0_g1_i1.p1 TRINITY_DN25103_c0_g1~~TRINITY_DN25103_c0_g1_i1.p1  ORF type:complete len:423 (-),score=109.21 TRINITY_DN25103_c0_g1_i1:42-1256(-)